LKKLLLILVALVVILAACGEGESSKKDNVSDDNGVKESENQKVEVDKGIFHVELTLPAAFFEGEDIDTVIADAKEDGVGEVIKNDDGSLT
jgi:ABC-type glycerol-3-phosphate transport system substrate-binding protein